MGVVGLRGKCVRLIKKGIQFFASGPVKPVAIMLPIIRVSRHYTTQLEYLVDLAMLDPRKNTLARSVGASYSVTQLRHFLEAIGELLINGEALSREQTVVSWCTFKLELDLVHSH